MIDIIVTNSPDVVISPIVTPTVTIAGVTVVKSGSSLATSTTVASSGELTPIASDLALERNRVVGYNNGALTYVDINSTDEVIGFTVGDNSANSMTTIQNSGAIYGFNSLIIGQPVFLAANGLITQTVPTIGRLQQVAIALSATKVLIQIQAPLFLN